MSAAERSIREELEAAMNPVEAPEAPEVPETDTQEETAATPDKSERDRDEKGRFIAKAADAGSEAEPDGQKPAGGQELAVPAVAGSEPAAPEVPQAQSTLAPPNGWSAEAKAKWATLPPEIQQAVNKREQDVTKFTSTRDEHASFGKEMFQAVQPYMAQIKAEGGTPVTAVQSLLNTAFVLRTGSTEQKKRLLLQTAQQFGVDLGIKPESVPEGMQPLYARISQLENMLAQQHQADALRRQQAEQATRSEVQQEIAAFAADPKHAHYAEVKAHMAALLGDGAAKDLQEAYDQACWANPAIRATLLAKQEAEKEQKRQAEAKAKAEAAKRKSIGITGGPGNTAAPSAPGSKGSVRDDLLEAFNAHSGAV